MVSLPKAKVRRFQRRILDWYAHRGNRDFIWRKSPTPYRVLVAEVMLQQTQVSRVAPKYREFLRRYPGIRALAWAKTRELLALWSGLGYNRRAFALRECARQILQRHGGKIPSERAALEQLPGIGPYTAAAINVFSRNVDEVCVDTNVRRVLIHELCLPHNISPPALHTIARQVMPRGHSRVWHNALMDYGRMVATGWTTKVRSRRRKVTPYRGSRRYHRGQILKLLLHHRQRSIASVARTCDLPVAEVKKIALQMQRDGLVRVGRGVVTLPA